MPDQRLLEFDYKNRRPILLILVGLFLLTLNARSDNDEKRTTPPKIEAIVAPAGANSGEPNLFSRKDGAVFLSWIELMLPTHTLFTLPSQLSARLWLQRRHHLY